MAKVIILGLQRGGLSKRQNKVLAVYQDEISHFRFVSYQR